MKPWSSKVAVIRSNEIKSWLWRFESWKWKATEIPFVKRAFFNRGLIRVSNRWSTYSQPISKGSIFSINMPRFQISVRSRSSTETGSTLKKKLFLMEKKRKEKGTRSRRMSFLELAESIQRSFWSNRWECGRHWAARARLYADIFLECFLRRRIFHGIFAMDAVVFGSKNQTIFNDSVATSRLSTWPVWRFKANFKKKRSFLLSQVFFFCRAFRGIENVFFFFLTVLSNRQNRIACWRAFPGRPKTVEGRSR